MRGVRNLQLGAGTNIAANANPLLSKEGQARSAGVVCSKLRSHLIDVREALIINRYCSPLNRPPQPSLREGIPALLRRAMGSVTLDRSDSRQQPRKPALMYLRVPDTRFGCC